MSEPFLICSLPRSRTAWLANFLTFGRVRCGHELTSFFGAQDVVDRICEAEASYAGNADTLQAVLFDDLMRWMPEAPRVVVVEREPAEVVESLQRIGLPMTLHALRPGLDALERVKAEPGALTVNFRELSSDTVCGDIWEHVAPGEPFDKRRCSILQGFNVQVTPARMREILKPKGP